MVEESMNIEDIKKIIFPVYAAGFRDAYDWEDECAMNDALNAAYNKWFENLVKDAGVYPSLNRRYSHD